jgi:hypothetical protein
MILYQSRFKSDGVSSDCYRLLLLLLISNTDPFYADLASFTENGSHGKIPVLTRYVSTL